MNSSWRENSKKRKSKASLKNSKKWNLFTLSKPLVICKIAENKLNELDP